VRKYKQDRKTLTQVAAAARAGNSERSAGRIYALLSQREARAGAYRCVIKPEPLHAEANIALEQGLYSRPGPFDTAYGTIA
jgi:hypothetical protein